MRRLAVKLIQLSGEEHQVDVIYYGLQMLVDGVVSVAIVLFIGILLDALKYAFVF